MKLCCIVCPCRLSPFDSEQNVVLQITGIDCVNSPSKYFLVQMHRQLKKGNPLRLLLLLILYDLSYTMWFA